MKIIKKRIGYYPEVLDLDKDKIDEIFNSGMDKTNIVGNVYLISRYQLDKNEKTFINSFSSYAESDSTVRLWKQQGR